MKIKFIEAEGLGGTEARSKPAKERALSVYWSGWEWPSVLEMVRRFETYGLADVSFPVWPASCLWAM